MELESPAHFLSEAMKAAKALPFRVLTSLRLPCGQPFGCLSRFARLSVFRGFSCMDFKRPDLRMVADGKLPLKAFDEHAAR